MRGPCILAAVVSLALLSARAETTNIPCSADTTLHELFADANFGARDQVNCGSTQHALPGGPSRTRGLIAFGLSNAIPADAKVLSASVRLNVLFSPGPVEANYELHRMLRAWNEGSGSGNSGRAALGGESAWNWSVKPDGWGVPGGQPGMDFTAAASAGEAMNGAGVYTLTSAALAQDVQEWIDHPERNFGWMLLCGSEDVAQTAKRFGSREGGSAAVLTVEFQPASSQLHLSIQKRASGVHLEWTGGTPPFQLQFKNTLLDGEWAPIGAPAQTNTADLPATAISQFFRVASPDQ